MTNANFSTEVVFQDAVASAPVRTSADAHSQDAGREAAMAFATGECLSAEVMTYANGWLATARRPDAQELAELGSAYRDLLATYASDPDAARQLISAGETKPDARLDPGELGAWTMIGNLLLNLDEVTNKG